VPPLSESLADLSIDDLTLGGDGDPNLSFEDADTTSGPDTWVVTVTDTARLVGQFANPTTGFGLVGRESFEEGWGRNEAYASTADLALFAPALYSAAFYPTGQLADGFEKGWAVQVDVQMPIVEVGGIGHFAPPVTVTIVREASAYYFDDFASVAALYAMPTPARGVGFEIFAWWPLPTTGPEFFAYKYTFAPSDLSAAYYAGGTLPAEGFEIGWGDTGGSFPLSQALYGGRLAAPFDDFGSSEQPPPSLLPESFILTGGNYLHCPDMQNAVQIGDRVRFVVTGPGTIAAGLQAGVDYYVVDVDLVTFQGFQVSATPSGAPITPVIGTGITQVYAPYQYWSAPAA
jgi:hypothetical protein